ncbi:MAG: hypothetical protein WC058_16340 [Phycisphaeraceae bacterium]
MSEATIRLICPNLKCRKILAVPESARGRVILCANCGTTVRVPDHRSRQPAGTTTDDSAKR